MLQLITTPTQRLEETITPEVYFEFKFSLLKLQVLMNYSLIVYGLVINDLRISTSPIDGLKDAKDMWICCVRLLKCVNITEKESIVC